MLTFPKPTHSFFLRTDILLKPREQRFIKVAIPFIHEITGLAKINLLNIKTGCTNVIKMKFVRNTGFLM